MTCKQEDRAVYCYNGFTQMKHFPLLADGSQLKDFGNTTLWIKAPHLQNGK